MIRGFTYKVKKLDITTIDGHCARFGECAFIIADDILSVEIDNTYYDFPMKNVLKYFWEAK